MCPCVTVSACPCIPFDWAVEAVAQEAAEPFVRDQEYAGRDGCLGVVLIGVVVIALLVQ